MREFPEDLREVKRGCLRLWKTPLSFINKPLLINFFFGCAMFLEQIGGYLILLKFSQPPLYRHP